MTDPVSLACGALRCDLVPELGAAIAGLWFGDVAVLRSTPGARLASVRQSGSYALVPFSNRIGDALLQWSGASHALTPNFAPEPHAIHGVGWQRAWQVLDAGAQFALLSYRHPGDRGWPFAFDCEQSFWLDDDGLELTLSVTNRSAAVAPFGLGWHPYFTKRAHSHVAFEAAGRWDMGADKLPTRRRACSGLDLDCEDLEVDHCFDGWRGVVQLRDQAMRVRLSSDLDRLVVFTNRSCDFVAIEPVSHVNNAINMARHATDEASQLGVQVLPPGGSMTARMRIDVGAKA